MPGIKMSGIKMSGIKMSGIECPGSNVRDQMTGVQISHFKCLVPSLLALLLQLHRPQSPITEIYIHYSLNLKKNIKNNRISTHYDSYNISIHDIHNFYVKFHGIFKRYSRQITTITYSSQNISFCFDQIVSRSRMRSQTC